MNSWSKIEVGQPDTADSLNRGRSGVEPAAYKQSTMQLEPYLNRIGYHGALKADLETLIALHRAHVQTIPYENLDIALGRTLFLDEATIYAKLVTTRRGGWCYEMNGLFAWSLQELGFNVTRLASTVGRQSPDTEDGSHMLLLVELDRPYLADVGFGSGLLEPIPLEEGVCQQEFLTYRLAQQGERWVFTNHGGQIIDFTRRARCLSDFAAYCTHLQSSPESWFVRTTVCHRFTPQGILTLSGAVLREVTANGSTKQVIMSREAYEQTLSRQFGLRLPEAELASLWQKVWERHVVRAA
jgi:N-hydroxyarylamine O-acetyltransferase